MLLIHLKYTSSWKYKTAAGEQREETEWFNCLAWGKLADICNQYLGVGKQSAVWLRY